MATVFIPSLLEGLTGGARTVSVPGTNLRQVIIALDERFPGMKERLLDEEGQLIPEIMAAIDGGDEPPRAPPARERRDRDPVRARHRRWLSSLPRPQRGE